MRSPREYFAFLLFGLICNFAYSLFLAAATDLCAGKTGNAAVLCADVIPSFLVTMICPHFMHRIPYVVRIYLCTLFTLVGYVVTCLSTELWLELLGIVLASLSTGLGEITFLALTAYYGRSGFNGWGCGSGFAGVVSTGLYFILRTLSGLSPMISMASVCWTPLITLIAWHFVLPKVHAIKREVVCRRRHRSDSEREAEPLLLSGGGDTDGGRGTVSDKYPNTITVHKTHSEQCEDAIPRHKDPDYSLDDKSEGTHPEQIQNNNKTEIKDGKSEKDKGGKQDTQEHTISQSEDKGDAIRGETNHQELSHLKRTKEEENRMEEINETKWKNQIDGELTNSDSVDSADLDRKKTLVAHSSPIDSDGIGNTVEGYWELSSKYSAKGNIQLKLPKSVIGPIKDHEHTKITPIEFLKTLKLSQKIALLGPMLYRYMICLFVVHFLSYTINTAIAPILCDSEAGLEPSDVNVIAQLMYRVGATIARSSVSWYLIPSQHMWIFMIGQIVVFLLLFFIPVADYAWDYVYIFIMCLFEGYIDGTLYSHTFSAIKRESHPLVREFNMGAAVVANYLGIVLSAVVSFWLQEYLENVSERSCPLVLESQWI